MTRAVPPSSLREHLLGFVSAFVAKPRRGRWRALVLAGKQRPQDAANDETWVASRCDLWSGSLPALLDSAALEPHRDREVVVYPLRAEVQHQEPRVATLAAAVLEGPWVEAVISVVPGELAVVLDHGGRVRVCRRAATKR